MRARPELRRNSTNEPSDKPGAIHWHFWEAAREGNSNTVKDAFPKLYAEGWVLRDFFEQFFENNPDYP